ncbi:MAG: ABC transporter [Candidatus Tokpelaia hoelldobleri]|uniref:ABC transporter n=1 Tax=Candidatus Tokpelaia hoelldobleri TaxID=1902579 RepID=A0A1U9JUJ7_9HYPH|nr:MAG: ABC transporter [Candidatus Tokpelaia hoelldoblerii]
MPAASPLVSLRKAGIKSGSRWLVRDIDLDIHRGEIITLIGPNGSGKSTTAKMALGILPPTTGKVKQQPHLKIGYVPQKINISPALPLTVERLMTLTGAITPQVMKQSLQEVGMAASARAEVATLSGGELQRVLLARAVARQPDLLVLDEPLQGVDFAGESALYQLISDYRDRLNCGILLVSHDLHIVMAASDRVLCLNGHICCSGKPRDVADSAEYAALFRTREQAHMLALYQHHHDHTHEADGRICRGRHRPKGKHT